VAEAKVGRTKTDTSKMGTAIGGQMKRSFFTYLCARIMLGGFFGIALAIFGEIDIHLLFKDSTNLFTVGLTFVGALILITFLLSGRRKKERGSKVAKFFIPKIAIWYEDLTGVFMYFSGVCLGALLTNLCMTIMGIDRYILPYFLSMLFFILASAILHYFCLLQLNQESHVDPKS
jgi:hypothetical protein